MLKEPIHHAFHFVQARRMAIIRHNRYLSHTADPDLELGLLWNEWKGVKWSCELCKQNKRTQGRKSKYDAEAGSRVEPSMEKVDDHDDLFVLERLFVSHYA
jgi:hypothetical protein